METGAAVSVLKEEKECQCSPSLLTINPSPLLASIIITKSRDRSQSDNRNAIVVERRGEGNGGEWRGMEGNGREVLMNERKRDARSLL